MQLVLNLLSIFLAYEIRDDLKSFCQLEFGKNQKTPPDWQDETRLPDLFRGGFMKA